MPFRWAELLTIEFSATRSHLNNSQHSAEAGEKFQKVVMMLKKLFERGAPVRTDEEKLSILLSSPIVDDVLRKQNEQLLKDRRRLAGEIAKIDAELNEGVAEFDRKIASAEKAFEEARQKLEEARSSLQILRCEKSGFQNQRLAVRNMLRGELRESAPMIDEFLLELKNLYFANQNLQFKEVLVEQRENRFGGKTMTFNQTDPAMSGWYEKLDKTIRAAEELKFEPDYTLFPERIEQLRAGVANPADFSPMIATVNTATGERIVEGRR